MMKYPWKVITWCEALEVKMYLWKIKFWIPEYVEIVKL